MEEAYENTVRELKRVDHLFYVSLKYTRTVDMIRHVVERIINTFSEGIKTLLLKAKEEKKIPEIPDNPALQAKLVVETYQDPELTQFVQFYLHLRKIIRADFSRSGEYRKGVTMTSTVTNGEVFEVNIASIKEDYERTKLFVHYVRKQVMGEKEEQ